MIGQRLRTFIGGPVGEEMDRQGCPSGEGASAGVLAAGEGVEQKLITSALRATLWLRKSR